MSDTSETLARQGATAAPIRWLLLTGNRLVVAVAMILGVAALFVAAGLLDLATVTTPNRVMWYLNGTVNGLLTLVPIAVGVNQIVLTHEFGSIKNLYERRQAVGEFRERVEERTDTPVSSPLPAEFFEVILDAIAENAASIRNEYEAAPDSSGGEVERYAQSVAEEAGASRDRLVETDPGMLDSLIVVLDYDDSVQYYETRRLNASPDTEFSEEVEERLDELEELFDELDAARQYIKTVVIERQLARLSRLLVYTGIPAVAIAALGIFTYRDVAGVALSHGALVGLAGALVGLTLAPLAILSAYILRVSTIARRTAAFGPFLSDPQHRPGEP